MWWQCRLPVYKVGQQVLKRLACGCGSHRQQRVVDLARLLRFQCPYCDIDMHQQPVSWTGCLLEQARLHGSQFQGLLGSGAQGQPRGTVGVNL
jgi:hypothetical protein